MILTTVNFKMFQIMNLKAFQQPQHMLICFICLVLIWATLIPIPIPIVNDEINDEQ